MMWELIRTAIALAVIFGAVIWGGRIIYDYLAARRQRNAVRRETARLDEIVRMERRRHK